jgi:gluconolactonase
LKRSDAWSPTAFASSGGNLWCGWGRGEPLDGVMIFNPVGNRIGKIDLPARCASIREFCAGPGWLSRHRVPVFRDVAELKLRVFISPLS